MGEEARKEEEFEQPTDKENERKETPVVRAPSPVKAYVPPIPFPQRLQRKKLDNQFAKFVKIFKKLHINIPFADAIAQMSSYAKFLNEILSNKRKLEEHETVCLNEDCTILLRKLPPKLKDPGSASVNLTPLSIYRSLRLGETKPTIISLQLADRSIKRPKGIIEDVLDSNIPLILGRPFLATGRALIDVYDGKMILRVDNEQVIFNVFKSLWRIHLIEHHTNLCETEFAQLEATSAGKAECIVNLAEQPIGRWHWQYESLGDNPPPPIPSMEKAPTLELKPLPFHLRYASLGESSTLPVIIANDMTRKRRINC
ncbi:uncharacterized protein LOC111369161 [Olea europaea var. sylvestris]|uniref:uncharacterized protein LOC111369161 n=1 Tax=Olea europaea var. sylvestris TaxID=158386 RepID=UPI000C1D74F0|nr:uncharacterized protein LOC111369161 [Olea europaea var. sylvestris]